MLRTTTLTCFLALALTACIESGGGGGGNGPAPAATGDLAQTLTARVEQNLSTLDELLSIAKTLPMGGEIEDAERPDIEELRAWLEDEANIESKSAAKIVYRVRPEEMCDEGFDSPDCVTEAAKHPVRIVVIAGDPLRVEVLVGEAKHRLVAIELSDDRVALTVDVAELARGLLEAAPDAPVRFEQAAGTITLSVQRVAGGGEVEARVEGLTLRGAADGEAFSLVAQKQSVALKLTRENGEPALTASVLLAGLEASFPICEEDRCETLGFKVPRIETTADTAGEAITIAWKQAGMVEALLDGARLFGYSLADTQVTLAPTEAGTEAVFAPGIDLSLEVKTSKLVELIGEELLDDEEPPQDEVLSVTFDGAAAPTLSIEEEITRIVAGTLRFSSASEGTAFEASAPACLVDSEQSGLTEVACP